MKNKAGITADNNSLKKVKSVKITLREREIIRLACQEYNSLQIAEILEINVRTVETHRKRLIHKVNAKNFIGVILYALKNRIIVLDQL